MAKEHTVIGFSRSTIATIGLIVVVLGAMAFWQDRGKAKGATTVTKDIMIQAHEGRLFKVEGDVVSIKENHAQFKDEVKDRFVGNEKMQISLQKDQQTILNNQTDIKREMSKQSTLRTRQREDDVKIQMKLIEEVGNLSGYLRSIEKIETEK